jgi:hypothetical protein
MHMEGSGDTSYALHGLVIESPLALDATIVSDRPDYRVELAEPQDARHKPPGRCIAELHQPAISYWCCEAEDDPTRWLLRYPALGDFTVDRTGGTIAAHPRPDVAPDFLGLLLAGSVAAHLIDAAGGDMVLHASAVEVAGSALAIAGPSGVGKSTLAAALCGAGGRLVSDDTLRVSIADEGADCFRGATRIRLRSAASELARIEGAEASETIDGRLGVDPPQTAAPRVRLGGVVVPVPSREAAAVDVERLAGRDALVQLLRSPRVAGWKDPDRLRSHFESCASLVRDVPVFRAVVPWGPPFDPGIGHAVLESIRVAAQAKP